MYNLRWRNAFFSVHETTWAQKSTLKSRIMEFLLKKQNFKIVWLTNNVGEKILVIFFRPQVISDSCVDSCGKTVPIGQIVFQTEALKQDFGNVAKSTNQKTKKNKKLNKICPNRSNRSSIKFELALFLMSIYKTKPSKEFDFCFLIMRIRSQQQRLYFTVLDNNQGNGRSETGALIVTLRNAVFKNENWEVNWDDLRIVLKRCLIEPFWNINHMQWNTVYGTPIARRKRTIWSANDSFSVIAFFIQTFPEQFSKKIQTCFSPRKFPNFALFEIVINMTWVLKKLHFCLPRQI